MTGEQLERASYDKPKTVAKCHECGGDVDIENGGYGISLDAEKHCCFDCMAKAVKITTYNAMVLHNCLWSGYAQLEDVEVTVRNKPSSHSALKAAFDYAEMNFEGVPAYIEEG